MDVMSEDAVKVNMLDTSVPNFRNTKDDVDKAAAASNVAAGASSSDTLQHINVINKCMDKHLNMKITK